MHYLFIFFFRKKALRFFSETRCRRIITFRVVHRSSANGVSPPNGISDTQRRGDASHSRTHRLLHFCAVPGLTWFFAGRTVMTGLRLPGRVHSRFCPGNSLSCSKRERNSRWISIGGRRAPPIAKRPCHDYRLATGYRSLPIARRALNFDLANLACRWLTASGGRPGSLSSWLTIRICFYLSTKWLINNVSIFLSRLDFNLNHLQ